MREIKTVARDYNIQFSFRLPVAFWLEKECAWGLAEVLIKSLKSLGPQGANPQITNPLSQKDWAWKVPHLRKDRKFA